MLITCKGLSFESKYDNAAVIGRLLEAVENDKVSSDFATSLATQYLKRGRVLSEKQWPWVHKIIHDLENGSAEKRLGPVKLQLIWPELRAALVQVIALGTTFEYDGLTILLSISGVRSKNPGSINLTENAPFSKTRPYYGRISPDLAGVAATFHPFSGCPESIVKFATMLGENPDETIVCFGT